MKIDLVFSAEGRYSTVPPEGGSPARGGHGVSGGKNYTESKAPGERFFRKILEVAARELKLKEDFSISVNLVGEAKIKELNRKYRNKNKATDVLSFPMQSFGSHHPKGVKRFEGPFDYAQGISNAEAFDIGDIFLCLSIAKNDAKGENINIKQKLAQLTIHGFLHLLGYDHERSKNDADKMFRIEGKILNKLNKI